MCTAEEVRNIVEENTKLLHKFVEDKSTPRWKHDFLTWVSGLIALGVVGIVGIVWDMPKDLETSKTETLKQFRAIENSQAEKHLDLAKSIVGFSNKLSSLEILTELKLDNQEIFILERCSTVNSRLDDLSREIKTYHPISNGFFKQNKLKRDTKYTINGVEQ